jgi:uncharacterized membrane protein
MFNFFRKKATQYFSEEEKQLVTSAIQSAEHRTSGEVRVFVESKCAYMNALDRAIEIFNKLKMHQTAQRNAVLVYVAVKDRQLAIYGDKGIHEKVGDAFWNESVQTMLSHFNANNYAQGIADVIKEVGEALREHFPYDAATDINELPDDIVFGR